MTAAYSRPTKLTLNLLCPSTGTMTHGCPTTGAISHLSRSRLLITSDRFAELAASDLKIVIQDPRSSTPGLGLLLWVQSVYGATSSDVWTKLADNIVTVTPGWSEAYGLFLEGEADAVLSYTTSPAYHLIAEGDDSFTAWSFDAGHYMQVEVAAMLADTDQPELARAFLEYLVSVEAQSVIPTTNWMYPATALPGGLPDGFGTLVDPKAALLIDPAEVPAIREAAIEVWRNALSR